MATAGSAAFAFAVGNAVLSFWSNGVMANFRGDPQGAPNWAASVSILTTIAALVLLAIAVVL